VDEWLRSVLWESIYPVPANSKPENTPSSFEIHRLKGILVLEDGSTRIIQAVRDVFEIRDTEPAKDDGSGPVQCKIVLIGRGIGSSADPWKASFESYVRES
jgi:hypothetical protein